MIPAIVGLVVIGIGALLVMQRRKAQDKLLEIKSTQTSTAKDLTDMCRTISEELGTKGGFKQQSEVKGFVKCDQPLTSELAKQPCVYYAMTVEERYEETYMEKDAQGTMQRKTRTGATTVASNSQRVHFQIEDETGRITVNPNNANIDPIQVISKYEPYANRNSISFGAFTFQVPSRSGDRHILGYQFTESLIPLNRRAFVLGEASDGSGELMIQAPSEKGKPFIITLKSEEELTKATESSIAMLFYGAVACFAIGAGLIGYGIMNWSK